MPVLRLPAAAADALAAATGLRIDAWQTAAPPGAGAEANSPGAEAGGESAEEAWGELQRRRAKRKGGGFLARVSGLASEVGASVGTSVGMQK